MSLFLKIVLGSLVALSIAGLAAVVGVRMFLKRLCAEHDDDTPLSVHLHEDLHPDWVDEEGAKAVFEQLTRRGFSAGRAFVIEEMQNVKLYSCFH